MNKKQFVASKGIAGISVVNKFSHDITLLKELIIANNITHIAYKFYLPSAVVSVNVLQYCCSFCR